MQSSIKKLLPAILVAASFCGAPAAFADDTSAELTSTPRIYQRWFEEAAAEFNVPVELLESIAYTETRWRPHVPKGMAKNTAEQVIEVQPESGKQPPSYGIMGLRNDTYFGQSLINAAALIHEKPVTLLTDTKANIRGAAALLAQYGNGKDRFTPLEQWEEAVAKLSGIPQRDISEMQSYEVLTAVKQGRGSHEYKIRQRDVDVEKVYGKEKFRRLSAQRLTIESGPSGSVLPTPDSSNPPARK
jgi:hypothetical protein